MDGLSAEIEALEAFAFERGEWMDWDASEWNRQLLLFCFVRDASRHPRDPIRATPEDLPLLVRDPRADPEVMAQTLLQCLRWQARQQDQDVLSQLASACRAWRLRRCGFPSFFAFLWFTCLIAQGYPDAEADGLFHQRFARLFPRADLRQLASLHEAWELLSEWLDEGQSFEGFAYSGLELPPHDPWRRHISHSWHLAFPSLRDRRQLASALADLRDCRLELEPTNPELVSALLGRGPFSRGFQQQLQTLQEGLSQGSLRSAWFVELLSRELDRVSLLSPAESEPALAGRRGSSRSVGVPARGFGPLLLRSMDYALGVLLLAPADVAVPAGLVVLEDEALPPGQRLWAAAAAPYPDFAAYDAGSLAIDPQRSPLPVLQPLLQRGVLPFARDEALGLPRLVFDDSCGPISHALVRSDRLEAFLSRFQGELCATDEEHWQGVSGLEASASELLRFPEAATTTPREERSSLSTVQGIRLPDGAGFLASGLGLPRLRVHGPQPALTVLALTATGEVIPYHSVGDAEAEASGQLWQPGADQRRRTTLAAGAGRLVAFFVNQPTLERRLPLAPLPPRVVFRRDQPLAHREDWGLTLGPLQLTPAPEPTAVEPSEADIAWARAQLNRPTGPVPAQFEEQMLDSLVSLFQRFHSIRREQFFQLHFELLGRRDHWPLFHQCVLRGWCEGGWLEEGLEHRRGHWRLQPVDPRLVRLPGGRAQLVGLLPSRGLVQLLAQAHRLGMEVEGVPPSCQHMPRGWRFTGRVDELGLAFALPVVEQEDWLGDPRRDWFVAEPLASDAADWPPGIGFRMRSTRVCGTRGRAYHSEPQPLLAAGLRAPNSLSISEEVSRYGRRRWHSHDPECDQVFSSCHRNRAALHALAVATDGLWPFRVTSRREGQIERLYDAEAYLPLPLGRWAALTGRVMPGPTRQQGPQHTYRYHFDPEELQALMARKALPLT